MYRLLLITRRHLHTHLAWSTRSISHHQYEYQQQASSWTMAINTS